MVAELLSNALSRAQQKTLTAGELLHIAGHISASPEAKSLPLLYRTWIENHPTDPLLPAVHFNLAVILSATGDLAGARASLEESIRINPDFIPPYINLGNVMERQGASGDAVQIWYQAANRLIQINGENANYKTTALKQIGRVLERFQIDEKAEEALKLSLDINPHQSDVVQHWVSLRQRQCKWPVITPTGTITKEHLLKGISALSLAAYTDDPLLQLGNAALYTKQSIGRPKKLFNEHHAALLKTASPRKRRVGYLSSDLREHAVGFLTVEVYELHNRENIEVFLYYCGIESPDYMQQRIKAAGDHWIDLSGMTDEQAAERMVADGIEILIDVNGYTNSARTKLLSMRPAPIIVNWLGFPGTLGNPSHHYIVADDFIIPPENEIYYSEKVLRLPCYQPNDRKRAIADRPTRAAVGLPEDATVFCCFNGVHKITPFTWLRWMTILHNVPGSVLWLLDSIESVSARLKELAVQHGIAADRIIFAPKAKNAHHLARYPLADLFLDTSPYGAHTTSSDALWMGVPVLTLAGRSFASRVCGSLVKSAGLEDLVVYTPEDFVRLGIELGRDKARLNAYREKLAANRNTCVLFNMPLLVSSLERLYAQMWDEYKSGQLPRPDLSNVDIYNEIGIELDNNDVELLAVKDYNGLYRQKLAERHEFCYIAADRRLWTSDQQEKADRKSSGVVAALQSRATAAAQSGDLDLAEQLILSAVELEPQNANILDLTARIMLLRGKGDDAETYARRAVAVQPLIPFGLTLAEALRVRGYLAGAESFFNSILQGNPNEPRALIGLADICEQTGRTSLAAKYYEAALKNDPANMSVAIKFSRQLGPSDLQRGLSALQNAVPQHTVPPRAQLAFFNHFAPFKEQAQRASCGRMPYHVADLSEMFFNFASAERDRYEQAADTLLAQDLTDVEALGAKAACVFAKGQIQAAAPLFSKLAALRPGTAFENVTFDAAFYEHLERMTDADILNRLPPVTAVLTPTFKQQPIVYLSCNHRYFIEFARPMLLSMNATSPGTQVHLHVMDADTAAIQAIKTFCEKLSNIVMAVSVEAPGLAFADINIARAYYHAIRLIRMYELLTKYQQPLWMMDVDALIHRNLTDLLNGLAQHDVAFRARPGRWEPWNQFNASVFAVAPTTKGAHYLRLIAAYIAKFYQQDALRWGIDQLAMYGVYLHLQKDHRQPSPYLLGQIAVDYEYRDDGFVWCNSGIGKFGQQGLLATEAAADGHQNKYLNLLKEYAPFLDKVT
jgi:predicted O-linked N-acetylglucosamine transferase (SPINDLY family)/Flp pilus assembly protein TadD